MSKILDFSDMLISKFCHDLAGGIGAVNNGIEIIEDPDIDQNTKNMALELISSNGKVCANRLKFFRYIYGKASHSGEADLTEIKEISKEFFSADKIHVEWLEDADVNSAISLTHKEAKLIFNMAYAISSCLISGGKIKFKLSKTGNGKKVKVIGEGEKIKIIDDIEHIVNNHELRDIKVNNVQYHLTSKLACELEAIINVSHVDSSYTMTAELSI